MASSIHPFPIAAVKGCHYEGQSGGTIFKGTITDATERSVTNVFNGSPETFTTFFDGEYEAFGFLSNWGSWYIRGSNIEVVIPFAGTYMIFDVDLPL